MGINSLFALGFILSNAFESLDKCFYAEEDYVVLTLPKSPGNCEAGKQTC